MDKYWNRIIEKDNRKIARIERALEKIDRAKDRADKKAEIKALREFEKIADKEMGLFDRRTNRDYW